MYWQILKFLVRRPITSQLNSWVCQRCYTSQATKPKSKPLRILFCGSDDFSSASLRALHDEQRRNPSAILSIDVLCRPGKPSGRFLKKIRNVPIKAVAEELGLPVHERDTFTGWDLPKPQGESVNLILAVSFGLFVPPRILRSVEYGGLNVHPSILPSFRGPSPLQYTILTGATYCGATLQTLDETRFDRGIILASTDKLPIPLGNQCTYNDLLAYIMPVAATLLLEGLRSRVYMPPLINTSGLQDVPTTELAQSTRRIGLVDLSETVHQNPQALVDAPKITPADRWANWMEESAVLIERRHRALSRLWNEVMVDPKTKKRIVFEDMELVDTPKEITSLLEWMKGLKDGLGELDPERRKGIWFLAVSPKTETESPNAVFFVNDGSSIIIAARDGALRVKSITVEGKKMQDASKVFESMEDWNAWTLGEANSKLILKKS